MVMNNMFQWVRHFSGVDQSNPQHQSFMRHLQKELKAEQPLTKPISSLRITVLDLETSGFYPDGGDKILSIGAVKIKNSKVQTDETFYTTVQEPDALSKEIEELTGLNKEELREAPLLADALTSFYNFAQTDLLVAHHASHERKFLQHATYQAIGTSFKHRLLDTSFLMKIAAPDHALHTLDDWCGHYEIPVENRHNALGDAVMTAELWKKAVEQTMEQGFETLHDVYAHLNSRTR